METSNIDWCKFTVITAGVVIVVSFWGTVYFFLDKHGVMDAIYSFLFSYFFGK